jgi:Zn-dependent protease with chaperone function
MRVDVYVPLVISAVLGVLMPALVRALRPATSARLLLAAGVVAALTSAFTLGVLAFTLIGQIPLVADAGGWSARSLRAHDPVAAVTATVAGLALTGTAALLVRTCVRLTGALGRAGRACRGMSGEPGGLVVIDDPRPSAYAVPAGTLRIGRVVVSSGMLRALSAAERRALLAHEGAHLRHRHHLYRMAASAVASLNPLLTGLPAAIEYATERWADELAADHVGDRRVVARAVARAALSGSPAESAPPKRAPRRKPPPARGGDPTSIVQRQHAARETEHGSVENSAARSASTTGFGDRDVARRVAALLTGPPERRRLPAAVLCALLALSVLTARETLGDVDQLFDRSAHPPVAHVVHQQKGRTASD